MKSKWFSLGDWEFFIFYDFVYFHFFCPKDLSMCGCRCCCCFWSNISFVICLFLTFVSIQEKCKTKKLSLTKNRMFFTMKMSKKIKKKIIIKCIILKYFIIESVTRSEFISNLLLHLQLTSESVHNTMRLCTESSTWEAAMQSNARRK